MLSAVFRADQPLHTEIIYIAGKIEMATMW
jgi:hypothetical protein